MGIVALWLAVVAVSLGGCGDDPERPEDEDNQQTPNQPDEEPNDQQGNQDDKNNQGDDGNQEDDDPGVNQSDPNQDPDEPEPNDSEPNDSEPDDPEPLEPGGFGDWCDGDRPCEEDYHCVEQPFDGDRGMCTRGCEPLGSSCLGIPAPGTNGKCLYEPGVDEMAGSCAFICVLDHDDHIHTYDCPPELVCEEGGGAGQGNAYCVPPVE